MSIVKSLFPSSPASRVTTEDINCSSSTINSSLVALEDQTKNPYPSILFEDTIITKDIHQLNTTTSTSVDKNNQNNNTKNNKNQIKKSDFKRNLSLPSLKSISNPCLTDELLAQNEIPESKQKQQPSRFEWPSTKQQLLQKEVKHRDIQQSNFNLIKMRWIPPIKKVLKQNGKLIEKINDNHNIKTNLSIISDEKVKEFLETNESNDSEQVFDIISNLQQQNDKKQNNNAFLKINGITSDCEMKQFKPSIPIKTKNNKSVDFIKILKKQQQVKDESNSKSINRSQEEINNQKKRRNMCYTFQTEAEGGVFHKNIDKFWRPCDSPNLPFGCVNGFEPLYKRVDLQKYDNYFDAKDYLISSKSGFPSLVSRTPPLMQPWKKEVHLQATPLLLSNQRKTNLSSLSDVSFRVGKDVFGRTIDKSSRNNSPQKHQKNNLSIILNPSCPSDQTQSDYSQMVLKKILEQDRSALSESSRNRNQFDSKNELDDMKWHEHELRTKLSLQKYFLDSKIEIKEKKIKFSELVQYYKQKIGNRQDKHEQELSIEISTYLQTMKNYFFKQNNLVIPVAAANTVLREEEKSKEGQQNNQSQRQNPQRRVKRVKQMSLDGRNLRQSSFFVVDKIVEN